METKDKTTEPGDVQADIDRVALSLDSLLVNGIPLGVLQAASFNGVVERLGEVLLKDVDTLENDLQRAPPAAQPMVGAALGEMRATFVDLIHFLTRLKSFRSFSLTELSAAISRLNCYREDGARLIAILEKCFQTPKPFFANRPKDAAAAVDGFLADLPRIFETEWNAARSKASVHSA